MTDFILLLLIGACWTWGVFTLFHEGFILHKIGNILKEPYGLGYKSNWYTKPLFDCPPCMSSFHGGIIGLLFFGLSFKVLTFMICLCGLNFIIKSILFPEYE